MSPDQTFGRLLLALVTTLMTGPLLERLRRQAARRPPRSARGPFAIEPATGEAAP